MKIGFIGIGLMGGPLARNLIRAGKDVYFFARNKEHIEKTLAAGNTGYLVSNTAELADCDVVFTCLPLPQTVKSVMMENDGLLTKMKQGAVYIDTSTIDPASGKELEAFANTRGIGFLACTLGKGPAQAELAEEPLFVGGEKSVYEKMQDILAIIGSPVHYLGGVEQSYAFKIISNMIGMTNVAVLAEGIHLAEHAGIEVNQFIKLLADTGADSNQLARRGQLIADKDFANRFAVDLTLKDLRLGCTMAEEWNYKPYFTEKARDFYAQAVEEGLAKEDACAIYKVLK